MTSDFQDTLNAIDNLAVHHCGHCDEELGPEASSRLFCSEAHQALWSMQRSEPTPNATRRSDEDRFDELAVAHELAIAAAIERGVKVAVCARDSAEVDRFRHRWGLPRHQVIYATRTQSIRGVGDHEAVVIPGFWSLREAGEIWDYLRICRRRIDARGNR